MNEEYKLECQKIFDNCLFTAEAHHIIALKNRNLQRWLQVFPAVVAALSGTLTLSGSATTFFQILTAMAAVVAAITTVLDPAKQYEQHVAAAKAFTILKQDSDSLRVSFGPHMDSSDLAASLKILHDRYNDLVLAAPPTEEKAFEEARQRIKAGVHDRENH